MKTIRLLHPNFVWVSTRLNIVTIEDIMNKYDIIKVQMKGFFFFWFSGGLVCTFEIHIYILKNFLFLKPCFAPIQIN